MKNNLRHMAEAKGELKEWQKRKTVCHCVQRMTKDEKGELAAKWIK